jgi:hypothetical protein
MSIVAYYKLLFMHDFDLRMTTMICLTLHIMYQLQVKRTCIKRYICSTLQIIPYAAIYANRASAEAPGKANGDTAYLELT